MASKLEINLDQKLQLLQFFEICFFTLVYKANLIFRLSIFVKVFCRNIFVQIIS